MQNLSPQRLRKLFLEEIDENELEILKADWPLWARLKQRPPLCDWRTWLVLGGRGAGKTRTGAEWLKGVALADPHYPGSSGGRVALVGTSYDDMRDVMVEGESGLLAIHRKSERPQWIASRKELIWQNGTIGKLFSSVNPEGLRGNQFGAVWCDAKTIWGALLAVGASLVSALGISIDQEAQNQLADAMIQLIGAVGAMTAIYGRLSATEIIQ